MEVGGRLGHPGMVTAPTAPTGWSCAAAAGSCQSPQQEVGDVGGVTEVFPPATDVANFLLGRLS